MATKTVIRCTECGRAIRANEKTQLIDGEYYCAKHIKSTDDGAETKNRAD